MRDIKRQRKTILTEENLKKILSEETTKLNIEHHHWLKESFLSKIGQMAPNLKELILRRVQLTDQGFTEIFHRLHFVEKLDITDCFMIGKNGFLKFIENCGSTLQHLSAGNC